MRNWVQEILDRYGQTAALETAEGTRDIRAFLQPLHEREEQLPTAATELGWVDGRLWLYLGRDLVSPGDTVLWNGTALHVRSSRPHYICGVLIYCWASLERRWEAAE